MNNSLPLHKRSMEITERKGLGHPDTICDSIMDYESVKYSQMALKVFGFIPHHNLDKALLCAGRSRPKFGGGKIIKPMEIYMGDRATQSVGEQYVDLEKFMWVTGKEWVTNNLRYVEPADVKIISKVQPGSQDLQDIFNRKTGKYLGANDTSATVGYYPFTPQERFVKDLEARLNSDTYHRLHPESGEDIKIMAIRSGNKLDLTVSMAFVDRFIDSEQIYFRRKEEIKNDIAKVFQLNDISDKIELKDIHLNALDMGGKGEAGLFLTVSGTSGEAGDSGQAGRGNDPGGVIPLCRPMASEAAPGKNPVSHVGKIYSALSFKIAREIHEKLGYEEVYCWLVSRIGQTIDNPTAISIQVTSEEVNGDDINNVVEDNFDKLDKLCDDLANGRIKLS